MDVIDDGSIFRDFDADASVHISASTAMGVDDFYAELERILRGSRVLIDAIIPYSDTAVVAEIRKLGQLISEEYEADGVHVRAHVPRSLAAKRGFPIEVSEAETQA